MYTTNEMLKAHRQLAEIEKHKIKMALARGDKAAANRARQELAKLLDAMDGMAGLA